MMALAVLRSHVVSIAKKNACLWRGLSSRKDGTTIWSHQTLGPNTDGGGSTSMSSTPRSEDVNTAEKRMHAIEWFVADQEEPIRFEAMDGELLRTAALRRGVVSPHNGRSRLINCRGLGTCGTCAVEIPATRGQDRNAIENVRLSLPPHGSELQSPSLRLACQVVVDRDLQVWKRAGFWGQDSEKLAKFTPVETYFGKLEFLNDRVSPTEKN